MATYKWASPYEWLCDKADEWTPKQVKATLISVAFLHDSDTIQDLFESEMDEDGYFDDTDITLSDEEPEV
jgi:hypothetical protein